MARNWAITIGVNSYRYLQPLNYAVSDADAVYAFFQKELSFHEVYHFTDTSPPIAQDYGQELTSQPTSTTLERFLRTRFEKPFLTDGDNLWFFFAGHGIRHNNRDYLMPLDGDRGNLERSAIPLHYVSERLRRSGADNVILLIDACRNFEGRRDGVGIGQEKQQGVITLYSCSPQESAYEIQELQKGAFTHVLLESLRIQGEGNCATVERLYQRLRHDVRQLTSQYRRVPQTPYAAIEPPSKNHLILLPRQATLSDVETLKKEALRAEVSRQRKVARQLWIRVLTVSPGDPEAIEGIERLLKGASPLSSPAQPDSSRPRSAMPSPSPTPVTPGSRTRQNRASAPPQAESVLASFLTGFSDEMRSPIFPANSIGRRRVLQVLGWSGGGLVSVLVGRALWPSSQSSSTPSSTELNDIALFRADWEVPPLEPPMVNGTTAEFNVATVNVADKSVEIVRAQAEFYTEDLGNGVTLDMMAIPGGTFLMGSPASELARRDNEDPRHEVNVPAFSMGKYAVTQAQWSAVAALPKVERVLDASPSHFQGDEWPVEKVSWYEAMEFCQRLSAKTGKEYRLPSEAEWEYSCRAGTTIPFHVGETITTDLANYEGTDDGNFSGSYGDGPKGDYRKETTEVGRFPANVFGLYDMHGNVWEWCADHWHENYEGAPTDGSVWLTDDKEANRVLRGGSWFVNPRYCRSAYRSYFTPDDRNYNVGFRVSCSAPRT